jgi:hypothetical protein
MNKEELFRLVIIFIIVLIPVVIAISLTGK